MDKVALLGMMASGKSTLGKILAERLAMPFVDADEEIERRCGQSVADIFVQHGESEFRRRELQVVGDLLSRPGPVVLALGGGAFVQDGVREALRGNALSVYLRVGPEELVRRLDRTDRRDRPLLASAGDWRRRVAEMTAGRDTQYMDADVIFPAGSTNVREMGDFLARVATRLCCCRTGSARQEAAHA